MVIRLAEFETRPAFHDDPEKLLAFRSWIKAQPGFRDGWHATESTTGRTVAVSLWDDMASVLAMKDRPFPGGPLGAKPDRVVLFDNVERF
jgi:hypothetical protein